MVRRIMISGCVFAFMCAGVRAQESFTPDQIKKGAGIYSQTCSPCHGPHMADPQGAFDLRTFPPDQKNRFLTSVSKGKNSMPPWGGLYSAEEIETLWAYVMAGEKK